MFYVFPTVRNARKSNFQVKLLIRSGSPTRARTWDLRINSPSLYQLSYRGTADYFIVLRALGSMRALLSDGCAGGVTPLKCGAASLK